MMQGEMPDHKQKIEKLIHVVQLCCIPKERLTENRGVRSIGRLHINQYDTMVEVPLKYAFPLFTKHNSTDYLIKHDQIRVSDIWAFWQYIIGRYVKKYAGEKNFLLTLIEQARYFYEAAEKAPMKSQPLLYYYSFLNLVKVVVNVNTLNAFGTTKEYYHGIESCAIHKGDQLKDANVEIQGLIGSPTKVSVAYQFMSQLGDSVPVPPRYQIDVLKMLKSCIGIHRTYCETNNCKETYIQVCNLRLYKDGHRFFFLNTKYLTATIR